MWPRLGVGITATKLNCKNAAEQQKAFSLNFLCVFFYKKAIGAKNNYSAENFLDYHIFTHGCPWEFTENSLLLFKIYFLIFIFVFFRFQKTHCSAATTKTLQNCVYKGSVTTSAHSTLHSTVATDWREDTGLCVG